jgi:acyl transferase domain-containing protein
VVTAIGRDLVVVADPCARPNPSVTPIAIVGMAGAFPGVADVEQFRANVLNGVDCVTEVPPTRGTAHDRRRFQRERDVTSSRPCV